MPAYAGSRRIRTAAPLAARRTTVSLLFLLLGGGRRLALDGRRRHPVLDQNLVADLRFSPLHRGRGVAGDLPAVLPLLNRDHVAANFEDGSGHLVGLDRAECRRGEEQRAESERARGGSSSLHVDSSFRKRGSMRVNAQ